MYNLQRNLQKIKSVVASFYQTDVNELGTFPSILTVAKSDIEIIAMSITMEALGNFSENLLFSKMKQDYPALYELFPNLRNFNKRRRKL